MKRLEWKDVDLGNGRPFTGAWIETIRRARSVTVMRSRPFTGAWIETSDNTGKAWATIVAPSRGRGLKHAPRRVLQGIDGSPLHGGVD